MAQNLNVYSTLNAVSVEQLCLFLFSSVNYHRRMQKKKNEGEEKIKKDMYLCPILFITDNRILFI